MDLIIKNAVASSECQRKASLGICIFLYLGSPQASRETESSLVENSVEVAEQQKFLKVVPSMNLLKVFALHILN